MWLYCPSLLVIVQIVMYTALQEINWRLHSLWLREVVWVVVNVKKFKHTF